MTPSTRSSRNNVPRMTTTTERAADITAHTQEEPTKSRHSPSASFSSISSRNSTSSKNSRQHRISCATRACANNATFKNIATPTSSLLHSASHSRTTRISPPINFRCLFLFAAMLYGTLLTVDCVEARALAPPSQVMRTSSSRKLVQREPEFTIPNATKVLELSVGRSGSTFLMELLALIPNSFLVPEPYKIFETEFYFPDGSVKPPLPAIPDLVHCNFLKNQLVVNKVFWLYACDNVPWIAKNATLYSQCVNKTLDPLFLLNRCRQADLILVKVIRSSWLAKQLGKMPRIPANVKIVHFMRSPWAVVRSQAELGWFQREMYTRMVPKDKDPLYFHLSRVCSEMMLHTYIADTHARSHATDAPVLLTLRYEDIVGNFEYVLRRLLEFVGFPMNQNIAAAVKKAQNTTHANFERTGERLDIKMLEALARTIPQCQTVLRRYRY
eukprot:m.525140 g.525140  ORF g.525140 m.525140 type:complete len:442 (-) comp57540_c0_seq1:346-1671(-)